MSQVLCKRGERLWMAAKPSLRRNNPSLNKLHAAEPAIPNHQNVLLSSALAAWTPDPSSR